MKQVYIPHSSDKTLESEIVIVTNQEFTSLIVQIRQVMINVVFKHL